MAKGMIRHQNKESHSCSIYIPSEITTAENFPLKDVKRCYVEIEGNRLVITAKEGSLTEDYNESPEFNDFYGF